MSFRLRLTRWIEVVADYVRPCNDLSRRDMELVLLILGVSQRRILATRGTNTFMFGIDLETLYQRRRDWLVSVAADISEYDDVGSPEARLRDLEVWGQVVEKARLDLVRELLNRHDVRAWVNMLGPARPGRLAMIGPATEDSGAGGSENERGATKTDS